MTDSKPQLLDASTDYVKLEELNDVASKKQNQLTPGDNVTLTEEDVISVDLTDYLKSADASSTYETISDASTSHDELQSAIDEVDAKIVFFTEEETDDVLNDIING